MNTGNVKRFNRQERLGFIQLESDFKDVFVNISGIDPLVRATSI